MKHILLAEDDFDYASILKQYLELSGFAVTWAKDGDEALALLPQVNPDICVFDVMMPKMDGFTLAEKAVVLLPEVPFVFLTAKGLKEDKIKGLKLGADDYVVKPFEAEELILRIGNILKRTGRPATAHGTLQPITIGGYIFDSLNYTLKYNTITHRLTEKEARLVSYLNTNRDRIIKREEILTAVWGTDDFFSGRSMDVFISRLRRYFAEDSTITLQSYRGLGLEFKIK